MTEYKHVHVDCPGCKDHFLAPVNVQELTANLKPGKPEVRVPGYIPAYRCGDDCKHVHKNKNYGRSKIKGKCNNCEQLNNADKGPCPWCETGELEPVDEDELDELGIRKEEPEDEDMKQYG